MIRDQNGVLSAIFSGGKIATGCVEGDLNGNPFHGVRLQEIKNRVEIGFPTKGLDLEMVGPTLDILFVDPRSIDVLIRALERAKTRLEKVCERPPAETL